MRDRFAVFPAIAKSPGRAAISFGRRRIYAADIPREKASAADFLLFHPLTVENNLAVVDFRQKNIIFVGSMLLAIIEIGEKRSTSKMIQKTRSLVVGKGANMGNVDKPWLGHSQMITNIMSARMKEIFMTQRKLAERTNGTQQYIS
ncbi:MAG: hypothetical protein SOY06_02615 [Prevotella sp.]|nr:hypothetical protein [Bacteroidales bacterium]MDY4228729.1 hypothetical protein [Prevotella sp.]